MDDVDPPNNQTSRRLRTIEWFASFVYGSIATLVAIQSLSYGRESSAAVAAGVIMVGAIAIWFAHTVSRLVAERARSDAEIQPATVARELRRSWAIVSAAIPAFIVMLLALAGAWSVTTGLRISLGLGVASLAAVGMATAGGRKNSLLHQIIYVVALTVVGVVIVVLETAAYHG